MENWKDYQRKVKQAFIEDGKRATLIKYKNGAYDLATGKKSKAIDLTDTVYLIFKTAQSEHEEMLPSNQFDVMCSYSKKIDPTDTENVFLRFDYKIHKTLNIKIVRPGGTGLFYKMRVQR